jgi:tetratricopeptide (TPR) repeat protein
MTPELWNRLKPLFEQAVGLSVADREQFIADLKCEEEVRRELRNLVAAHAESGSTLENLAAGIPFLASTIDGQLQANDVLCGRFRIVRKLGSGGMGEVYEAFDMHLIESVALKTIRSSIVGDPEVLERFRREVQLARRLSGENLCRIHELFNPMPGDPLRGGAFFTMELLQGRTLKEEIRSTGALPWKMSIAIAVELCTALTSMHSSGMIHRDIKTGNVMMAERNGAIRPVLMDFGLARELAKPGTKTEAALTQRGVRPGTPATMAPEQFAGEPLSAATDVYAMGVLLYEMLTGCDPFAASDVVEAAILRARPTLPPSTIRPGLPKHLDRVVARCLEVDGSRRYQSATELARDLRTLGSVPARLWAACRRTQIRAIGAGALTLCLAAVAILVWWNRSVYRPSAGARNWYDQGLAALNEGAFLQAAAEFTEAVKADSRFALAHARRAQSWAELDYTGLADHELLVAVDPRMSGHLSRLDRKSIEAVRALLMHDKSAINIEKQIINQLPEQEKGYGYLDLGRAQERNNNLEAATESFEMAARLRPDNPAPFVQLGRLKSRRDDVAGAEAAFDRAEKLYKLKNNTEGLGELYFQRAHAANERRDPASAARWLEQCMEIARSLSSVPLEVRALTQRSEVAYDRGEPDKSIADAERAIQLARDNDLPYWVADGMMRESNAYYDKGQTAAAEKFALQALMLAQKGQFAHLTADVEQTLAGIREMQENYADEVRYARSALQYFSQAGYRSQAADSQLLLAHGLAGTGDAAAGLKLAIDLVGAARQLKRPVLEEQSEEAAGGALIAMERYPEALDHFQRALRLARQTGQAVSYQIFHCADTYVRLGRDREAEEMLRSVTREFPKEAAKSETDILRAQLSVNHKHYSEALATVRQARRTYTDIEPSDRMDLGTAAITADLAMGRTREAQAEVNALAEVTNSSEAPQLMARSWLLQARVELAAGDPAHARRDAENAAAWFEGRQLLESEWRCRALASAAARKTGDIEGAEKLRGKSLDTLQALEHNWGTPAMLPYQSRAEVIIFKQLIEKPGR